ncbi:MAG TPA: glutathione S-transferase family protein [Povalibacter sp.]|nr:glutathione S-transferase family protein [Povalibacter sp.]
MSLTLYLHPLASYCWKASIALYESGTSFEPHVVDLANETSRANFLKIWPIGKFPVLRDEARGRTIPESTIIIEYLAQYYPGRARLIPTDADLAREARLRDRFYDLYVHEPMQRIVADRLRPADKKDPYAVEQARAQLRTSYGLIDEWMATQQWAVGDRFTMADCAASPALFYANKVLPFGDTHPNVAAYLSRLMQRPAFARVIEEAQPYFHMFPQ